MAGRRTDSRSDARLVDYPANCRVASNLRSRSVLLMEAPLLSELQGSKPLQVSL